MESTMRARLAASHPDVLLLDAGAPAAIEHYLLAHRLVLPSELPCRIERAGVGNMNLVLRVMVRARSLILKQGRPWVEKYDHIAAPWERTRIEGWFYEHVQRTPAIAACMPRLLHLDEHNHILALEDLGSAADWSSTYAGSSLPSATLDELLGWLKALGAIQLPPPVRELFTNRAMRALNHEHIFSLPLRDRNGLDLDAITPSLADLADELRNDRAYCWHITELGALYLSDGASLVHGDFFPGSWIQTPGGVRVIDPEFCFAGSREFDYGVMLAHLALSAFAAKPLRRDKTQHLRAAGEHVLTAAIGEHLDERSLLGFAGTEIMRRLIGVAQLPVAYDLDTKRRLLDLSRRLVLSSGRRLEWA